MTRDEFELKLIDACINGDIERGPYLFIDTFFDILREHKDSFRKYFSNSAAAAYWYACIVDQ